MTKNGSSDILGMTAKIVAAYVGQNKLPPADVPDFIEQVFTRVSELSHSEQDRMRGPKPVPALPIEDSVTDAFIYSLEDGQPYKSLKRHLKAQYGMTPRDYRDKWELPSDYPMVAPAYARERSKLAKKTGLGRRADD